MYYLLKVRKENKLSKEQKSFNLAEFDFFLNSDMTCFDLRTESETDKEFKKKLNVVNFKILGRKWRN